MVNFDRACQASYGIKPASVTLARNYRSHSDIVSFVDGYITSFPEMLLPGVRAAGKRSLTACSAINGAYPAVTWLTSRSAGDIGDTIARFVSNHLLGDRVISDPSQCLVLMRSTRDSARNAGPLIAALQRVGLRPYNPRSKAFMDAEEVQCLFACLVHVLDSTHLFTGLNDSDLVSPVREWLVTLDTQLGRMGPASQPLVDYIAKSIQQLDAACRATPGAFLDLTILEIAYRVLSLEPFRQWRNDPTRNFRLSKVTRLLEAYHANRQDMLRSSATTSLLDPLFVQGFYFSFVGYLVATGIDEDEDEEVIVPHGYLPLMTIHQSKGLEFPVVIVTQLGASSDVSAAQQLEILLEPHRKRLYSRALRTPQQLAVEDDVRLLYVAYSRAQHGLVLAGTPTQFQKHVAVPGRDWDAFRRTYILTTT
jgi:DNA helicase-2/ATP-dependent DNA helicase PcrA